MLITPRGEPVPPQEAVRRLREIDERLTVRWVPSAAGAYWAIVETYKPEDPRWSRVHTGEITESQAFDLRAMLPPDCSAEQAVGFVERHFRPVRHAPSEAAEHVQRVAKHNASAKAKHLEGFLEEQEYKTARTSKHEHELNLGVASAHPISHGFGEGTTEGAKAVVRRKRAAKGGPVA